jgi:uncharacterized protein (DUF433 family)
MSLTIVDEPIPLTLNADGVVLVTGTRIPIDTVVFEFQQRVSPEEIVEQFTSLNLADVYAVIAYYLRHKDEVDAYLQERERQAEEIREKIEQRFPLKGLRDRLLARRAQSQLST